MPESTHQNRSTFQMNVLHRLSIQVDGLDVPAIEPPQAIHDSIDFVVLQAGHAEAGSESINKV